MIIKGYEVLIDDEDYNKVVSKNWILQKYKYETCGKIYFVYKKKIGNKRIDFSLHREIMNCNYKDNIIVDHINGNTLDCRKNNLRVCTIKENTHNQQIRKTNTSGLKGVSWHSANKKWIAQIMVDCKKIYLGSFRCAKKAYQSYCEASKKYHGEFSRIE